MLAPLVGPDLAMERANNIAQALMCPQGKVVREVDQMLANLDLGDSRYVAEEIVRAWQGKPVEPLVEVMVA